MARSSARRYRKNQRIFNESWLYIFIPTFLIYAHTTVLGQVCLFDSRTVRVTLHSSMTAENLNKKHSKDELEFLREQALMNAPEITEILQKVPSDLLLLLKTK